MSWRYRARWRGLSPAKSKIKLTPRAADGPRREPARSNPEAYEAFLQGEFFPAAGNTRHRARASNSSSKPSSWTRRMPRLMPGSPRHCVMRESSSSGRRRRLTLRHERCRPESSATRRIERRCPQCSGRRQARIRLGFGRSRKAEYKRALQLNPSHLLTRLWYAECLTRDETVRRGYCGVRTSHRAGPRFAAWLDVTAA